MICTVLVLLPARTTYTVQLQRSLRKSILEHHQLRQLLSNHVTYTVTQNAIPTLCISVLTFSLGKQTLEVDKLTLDYQVK